VLFNSFQFLAFIVPVLGLYFVLPTKWQNRMLIVAGCVFYGAWDWRFLGLLAYSCALDYWVGLRVGDARPENKKKWLVVSVISNLWLLTYFKYCNFFIDSFHSLAGWAGMDFSKPVLNIVLPVGISFYTFQSMSYVFDVYRGKVAVVRRLEDFALYVTFFPPLLAGPIERAAHFMPQLFHPRKPTWRLIHQGAWLILWGFFKKVFVADNLSRLVDSILPADPAQVSGLKLLVAAYAFTVQIYCDFSGYSDMARGIARIMGFNMLENFRLPFFATSLREFWTRWHISLSSWFRDYLYFPLGGSRCGLARNLFNIGFVFLVSGLWHGADYIFVAWGAVHGLGLMLLVVGEKPLARLQAWMPAWLFRGLGTLLTFHAVVFAFLFWRAGSVPQTFAVAWDILTDWSATGAGAALGTLLAFSLPLLLMEIIQERTRDMFFVFRWPTWARAVLYYIVLFCIVRFGVMGGNQFIYFQF